MSKYLEFVHREDKPKTKVWEVVSKEHGFHLGVIKYYGAWRQYSFFPYESSVFNSQCLDDIIKFMQEENTMRRELLRLQKQEVPNAS